MGDRRIIPQELWSTVRCKNSVTQKSLSGREIAVSIYRYTMVIVSIVDRYLTGGVVLLQLSPYHVLGCADKESFRYGSQKDRNIRVRPVRKDGGR